MSMFGVLSNHVFLVKIYIFLLFINDYSRKIWVYFLKEKSNVCSYFKKFKALVEKESSYSIK
jgi:hypothetical protein